MSVYKYTIAVALGITVLVLFVRTDWSVTPTSQAGTTQTFQPPATNGGKEVPVQAGTWPQWNKRTVLPGPMPWREACQYKEVNTVGVSYHMCIRSYDDIVSSSIRHTGKWIDCDVLTSLWKRESAASPTVKSADPEGIFVDAGANIGSCSMLMAAAGHTTYGFEPSRANFFYLTSSAVANDFTQKLNLFSMGLGEKASKAPVFVAKGNAGNSQLHSNDNGAVGDDHRQEFQKEDEITVGPLDDVLWPDSSVPAPHIRVMKMDVQGYEVKILKGAKRLLAAGAIGILKTELTPQFLKGQGTSPEELLTIMKSNNYVYYNDDGSTREITIDGNYPGEVMFIRKQ